MFGKTSIPDWEATLLGLMISEGACAAFGHSPTFTSADSALVDLLGHCVSQSGLGEVTSDGRLGYRIVNHAGRGGVPERNRAQAWLSELGLDVGADDKFVPQRVFTAPEASVRRFLQALFAGDGGLYQQGGESFFLEYYSNSRRLIEDVHHLLLRFGIFALIREKKLPSGKTACRIQITDIEQIGRFSEYIGFVPGSIKQRRLEEEILPAMRGREVARKSNFDTLPREAWPMLSTAAARAGKTLRAAGLERTTPCQSVSFGHAALVADATGDVDLASLVGGPVWDVVESIEPAGEEPVFDITVPGTHNFVANGLVVHNSTYARCGIIVNVTPFEPEWEGFVTLEFSNTTPLPAKIYANEGVAQVVFFESDEVCETSYKDRGGKYQGQQGVTLPKI